MYYDWDRFILINYFLKHKYQLFPCLTTEFDYLTLLLNIQIGAGVLISTLPSLSIFSNTHNSDVCYADMDEERESFGLPVYGFVADYRPSMLRRITAFVKQNAITVVSMLSLCLIVQNLILHNISSNCDGTEQHSDFNQTMHENKHPAVITCVKPDCSPALNVSSILSYAECYNCFKGLRVHRVFRDNSGISIDFDFTDYIHFVLWSEFDWKIYGDIKFPFLGVYKIIIVDDAPHAILRWSGLKVVQAENVPSHVVQNGSNVII